jgi:hypothetical protein
MCCIFAHRLPKGDKPSSIQEVDLELMLPKIMFNRYRLVYHHCSYNLCSTHLSLRGLLSGVNQPMFYSTPPM